MMWGWYGYGPCGFAWGWVFWLGVLILLGLGVWALVRALSWVPKGASVASPSGEHREDRALALLRERYARGELDEETYRRMKKALEE